MVLISLANADPCGNHKKSPPEEAPAQELVVVGDPVQLELVVPPVLNIAHKFGLGVVALVQLLKSSE